MKTINQQSTVFFPLNEDENYLITGGAFAFDTGRGLRWLAIASGYGDRGAGAFFATVDFIANMAINAN